MSLLRQLVDPKAFKEAPAAALLDAALLLRRAGLEHLVTEAERLEVLALARAGEVLAQERATQLVLALRDPARALEPFDGGAELRREVLREALAHTGRG